MQPRPLKQVLVTGAQGQLGLALASLQPQAQAQGLQLLLADKNTLNISKPDHIARYLDAHDIAAVVNTAAYTQVDQAENQADLAWQINAHAPALLAQACRQRHITLLHISTDYVFDGSSTLPWSEDDPTRPLSVYGKSKLAGEQAVLAALPDALIIRSSWLFSQFGNNFLKTMITLAQTHDTLRIVDDQIGGPTYAPHLALALLNMLQQHFSATGLVPGTYHFAGQPYISWYGFAQEIFLQAQRNGILTKIPQLQPISSADYHSAAVRPKNSCLSQNKLNYAIGKQENDWRVGLLPSLITNGIVWP
ncbi:MAG: dTDP-4-dehydrorhamnose reductase [Burkholderiaceae bacterium]|nr:dTDP-4-dehydrorhamnose reductase [Burkholderiaceae bacterium]